MKNVTQHRAPLSPLTVFFKGLTAQKIVNMKGREQESHWLDFKTLAVTDFSVRSDRETLAAAISGFANADGGILLWGVDARKGDDGVDQVIATPGVSNPRLALSRLNELTGEATSPVVVGVDHKVITGTKNPSFVATLVPASDAGPHMAMQGHDGFRYYTRAGGRFAKMHHSQVADMFGRRAHPLLEVGHYSGSDSHQFMIRISNNGRGAAQAPFFEFAVSTPFQRCSLHGGDSFGLPPVRTHRGTYLHAGGLDSIIHPTMYIDVCGVSLGYGQHFAERARRAGSHCVIIYKVGALGVPPLTGKMEIQLPS